MSKIPLLFFSYKVKECVQLIQLMKTKNIISYFKCLGIEELNPSQIPSIVKSVPTLIMPNMPIMVGNQVYQYITNMINNMQFNNIQQQMVTTQNYTGNTQMFFEQRNKLLQQNENKQKRKIYDYLKSEMNSTSDIYTLVKEDIDVGFSQNFANTKSYEEMKILPPPVNVKNKADALKINETDKKMKELISKREEQTNEIMKFIEDKNEKALELAKAGKIPNLSNYN